MKSISPIQSNPLHERRLLMMLVKKQMLGRRAYSDITKVKPSNREFVLYEKQERKRKEVSPHTEETTETPREMR